MKRILLITAVLAMLAAASAPVNLTRVTVSNKSGYEATIWLSELRSEQFLGGEPDLQYYLRIEKGSRDYPKETAWTIVPGEYLVRFVYISNGVELYSYSERLDLAKRTKIVLLPPAESGGELCMKAYESNPELKKCLDGLYGVKYMSESIWKFLPTMWLARMQP